MADEYADKKLSAPSFDEAMRSMENAVDGEKSVLEKRLIQDDQRY